MSSFRGWNRLTFKTVFPGSAGVILPGGLGGLLSMFGLSWGFDFSWELKLADIFFVEKLGRVEEWRRKAPYIEETTLAC